MEPSIALYNDYVKSATGPWDAFQTIASGVTFHASLEKYADLCLFLSTHTSMSLTSADVLVCDEHQEILNLIDLNRPFNLYNIDHHHDCGYPPDFDEIKKMYQEIGVTCGNWVYDLTQKAPTNFLSYTWIGNKNSTMPVSEIMELIPKFANCCDLQILDRIIFDKIFICLSPQWVPPQYYPLFNAMTSLFAHFIKK